MASGRWIFVFASVGIGVSCASFGSTDDRPSGGAGAGSDAAPECGAGCAPDAATAETEAGAGAGCPSDAGPAMVQVSGFCIDRTEVTVGQYAAFLQAMSELPNGGIVEQPPECAWNTTFKPPYWWPATPDEEKAGKSKAEIDRMPVSVVDWCDARAFCAWAGKRLCGRVGGGVLTANEGTTTASEWFVACSHNGLHAFPYGDDFVGGACNGEGSPGREPVGSRPACTGGYDGLLDMSGNLEEWIDACDVGEDGGATCVLSGGVYSFPKGSLRCDGAEHKVRSEAFPQAGFRCCATPAGP